MPTWLMTLATLSLATAFLCALIIAGDILRGHRQHMAIMELVWPLTALYAGPFGLWAYWTIGREPAHQTHAHDGDPSRDAPLWQSVGLATTHCGGGCTLGDLLAEGVVMPWLPFTLLGHEIFGAWAVDFAFAFLIGIAFQYFSIMPAKRQSLTRDLMSALKTDTLSLSAWQVGMCGWMAIATFGIFGHMLDRSGPVFWFMMQIAMLAGFATSYPVNAWLLRVGIKEGM